MGIMPFLSHTDGSESSFTVSSFTIVAKLMNAIEVENLEKQVTAFSRGNAFL